MFDHFDFLEIQLCFLIEFESTEEEGIDAIKVSVEVEFCIEMLCGDHLWEIDDNYFLLFSDHEIEFIEIGMNETILGKSFNEINTLFEYSLCIT